MPMKNLESIFPWNIPHSSYVTKTPWKIPKKTAAGSAICWNPMFQVKLFLQKPSSTQESMVQWYYHRSSFLWLNKNNPNKKWWQNSLNKPYFPPGFFSEWCSVPTTWSYMDINGGFFTGQLCRNQDLFLYILIISWILNINVFWEKNQRLHWNVLGIALGFSKNWRAIEVFINMETVNEHWRRTSKTGIVCLNLFLSTKTLVSTDQTSWAIPIIYILDWFQIDLGFV